MPALPLLGHGSGSRLPLPVLALAGTSALVAVAVSAVSISLHLRNYRRPFLQRMVVRIMVMVPLYAVASLISLFSLEAAFFIDAVRDVYEAFVIYCFFVLLLDYLGGERSLLILLHGRPPIPAVFPAHLWRSEIDPSDPYTFLFLKRGILQYVQVKPLLALASLIMKATGTYHEGDFRARSGYLYVSIVYNISICLALWCLAVFWMCVHQDLKPFRPVPKFLCVKGILFFSFWQSIAVSLLVAVGVITRLGPYTDSEHISLGLTDTLICIEMPFFAAAHMYAFSYRDFTRPPPPAAGNRRSPTHVARMTLGYALRDAIGLKDLVEDTRATLRGEGINYRAFEPSEGGMHIGAARDRRIRAGLRYAAGGKRKYWLPERDGDVTAPLFAPDADDAPARQRVPGDDGEVDDGDEYALKFGDDLAGPDGADEVLYDHAKNYVFGDYLYPVVDVSSEEARRAMWEDEERVVQEIASRRHEGAAVGYGATQSEPRRTRVYDSDDDDVGTANRSSSRAPSPLLDRPSARPSPSHVLSRLTLPHLPRLLSTSTSTSSTGSAPPPSASPSLLRAPRRAHAPLVEEDAVDLVVAVPEGLRVPTASRGSCSPGSPGLIRVWDELGPVSRSGSGSGSPARAAVAVDAVEGERADVRFVMTVDDVGGREERGGADGVEEERVEARADVGGYDVGMPDAGEDGNPWA